ncbi:hypothetical protein N7499_000068 [Penicillium canescens]|uniref:Uncharacterized protein n=1 Tax=Penicillium canescens TaxID=5083 RepID=A0AAD6IHY2_PENCN|nr:uncharacterized protein N7446_011731 [Penicillium canescens]KAJ6004002.1 hypothetical protein N7522_005647 [Penicillium canescens]KAJ6028928.1 hypothetical protein N7444_011915 [Penicillium canescens]KAJ6047362.1 hypothetical protein N7460_003509 [Penicillium canescens]KAJ6049048.1 hypothetical protein N7446_011731 [Penicillium canescens]KAJ6100438.1 hypothetical protein N7499_000068 [Penicillium canescens]
MAQDPDTLMPMSLTFSIEGMTPSQYQPLESLALCARCQSPAARVFLTDTMPSSKYEDLNII